MPSLPALASPSTTPVDPARIGFAPTLPIEVVLKTAPIRTICEAYGLDSDDWEALRVDPVFVAAVQRVSAEVLKEGVSFKMKARLQSEQLLQSAWNLVHDATGAVPPSVKADMIKAIWRVAGLEPTKADGVAANTNAFQINIDLSGVNQ